MEVTVKIDKFGRVLIPKKIREAKGYTAGTELSIVMEPEVEYMIVKPKVKTEPYVIITDYGLPLIVYPEGPRRQSTDAVQMIAEDREERSRVTSGYYRNRTRANAEEE